MVQGRLDHVDNSEDKIRFTILFLAALKVFVGSFGFNFFNDEQLAALENLLPFLFVIYGFWKNNYLSKKGKAQKQVLEQRNLE